MMEKKLQHKTTSIKTKATKVNDGAENNIEITQNGSVISIASASTLLSRLQQLGILPQNCIAELNGEIVERNRYAEVRLQQGDVLELVRFVGGG